MQVPASIKSTPWRAVAGLLLAGLLGWLAAWFVIPANTGTGPAGKDAAPAARRPTASGQTVPDSKVASRPEDAAPRQTLEQLLQKQNQVSEGAARSAIALPTLPPASRSMAAGPSAPTPGSPDAKEAARAARMKAMRELQTKALADIQAVPPGDTKGLMAAMGRFDAQMQAAGAPALIDMDNLRKTLEGADRLQLLNRQLVAEAEKGRTADVTKVKALTEEIQTIRQAMPRQFIKTEVLQKQMAP
jgi:hypothetical protein